MRPGDVAYLTVRVLNAGVAVTGLVTAGFAVTASLDNGSSSLSFTATEVGSGYYRLAVTMPATAGWVYLRVSSGSYTVQNAQWTGEIEAQDLDSVYAVSVRPVVTQTGATVIGAEQTLEVIAYRYTPVTFAVTDQDDNPINLSGYNNWRFTVKTKDQATTYTLSSGITGSALGVVAWNIPEDASFFSLITAAIAAGQDETTLYWDVVADEAATASKSKSVVRGRLTLRRSEGAA